MDDNTLLLAVGAAYATEAAEVPEHVRRFARAAGFAELAASLSTPSAAPYGVRLERRLAPAAATGGRVLAGMVRSADARFRTQTFETPDEHLLLTVSTDEPFAGLVRVMWTCMSTAGVPVARSLVTPLVAVRDGWAAEYDLGSVNGCEAVAVVPAEAIAQDQATEADVDAAFSVTQHGSAARAWRRALLDQRLEPRIAAMVETYLR